MKAILDYYYSILATLTVLKNDEKGQTLVEYALIIVVIALAVIAAMLLLKGGISNAYSTAAGSLH